MWLRLDGVGHRFGAGPWLFRGLQADLGDGQIIALTGPSGSGKSTLLTLLAGWDHPAEGQIDRSNSTVTWVAQNPFGVAQRSALDHVALPLLIQGLRYDQAQAAARRALERFGLSAVAEQPFRRLSGGEAQRLMLARAAISDASVLLVDEPTAQLDPGSAALVISCLTALAAQGRIVVIATHDPRVSAECHVAITLGAMP